MKGLSRRAVPSHADGPLVAGRKIVLLVKAGPAVDAFIDQLIPLLSPGDIIIDSGNTHFSDTERRTEYVQQQGLLYIGTGISGGEEGALKGPSMMPGGSESAWPEVKEIFQAISAKVGPNDDIPCAEWVGPRGAGHYVKMVHNGIEYGDMQMICEAYDLMQRLLGLTPPEMGAIFTKWNEGSLDSFLIEITADILQQTDPAHNHRFLVDAVLEREGDPGVWTPVTTPAGEPVSDALPDIVVTYTPDPLQGTDEDPDPVLEVPGRSCTVVSEQRAKYADPARREGEAEGQGREV